MISYGEFLEAYPSNTSTVCICDTSTNWKDEYVSECIIEEDRYYKGDKIPELKDEFEALEKALEILWPEITFLNYKKLSRKVVKHEAGISHDYYSEWEYVRKFVVLKELYDKVQEMKNDTNFMIT